MRFVDPDAAAWPSPISPADGVADNTAKFDPTESESLIFGTDFGVGTDVRTGPNGNLYVVSLSNGAVYEIYRPDICGPKSKTHLGYARAAAH
jgi:hypothetical protein